MVDRLCKKSLRLFLTRYHDSGKLVVMEAHTDPRGRRNASFPNVFVGRVAKTVGIDPGWLSKILRGLATPSLGVAKKLAGEFGMTIDELLVMLDKRKQVRRVHKYTGRFKRTSSSKT